MEGGGGKERGERGEEELEGEERGGERRESEEGSRCGEDGGEVRVRVRVLEEWVEVYEEDDALCLGVICGVCHWRSEILEKWWEKTRGKGRFG